jgi:hypothetical protein
MTAEEMLHRDPSRVSAGLRAALRRASPRAVYCQEMERTRTGRPLLPGSVTGSRMIR